MSYTLLTCSHASCTLRYASCTLRYAFRPLRYASCTLRFLHTTLRFLHATIRFLHATLRFLHATLRFSHATLFARFCGVIIRVAQGLYIRFSLHLDKINSENNQRISKSNLPSLISIYASAIMILNKSTELISCGYFLDIHIFLFFQIKIHVCVCFQAILSICYSRIYF
jgi:hypothetical protein